MIVFTTELAFGTSDVTFDICFATFVHLAGTASFPEDIQLFQNKVIVIIKFFVGFIIILSIYYLNTCGTAILRKDGGKCRTSVGGTMKWWEHGPIA